MHDDTTLRMRVLLLRTGDDARCFGCGHELPEGQVGRGTSRYSRTPTVHLCSDCCVMEAFRGDCFLVEAVAKEAERQGTLEPARTRMRLGWS